MQTNNKNPVQIVWSRYSRYRFVNLTALNRTLIDDILAKTTFSFKTDSLTFSPDLLRSRLFSLTWRHQQTLTDLISNHHPTSANPQTPHSCLAQATKPSPEQTSSRLAILPTPSSSVSLTQLARDTNGFPMLSKGDRRYLR